MPRPYVGRRGRGVPRPYLRRGGCSFTVRRALIGINTHGGKIGWRDTAGVRDRGGRGRADPARAAGDAARADGDQLRVAARGREGAGGLPAERGGASDVHERGGGDR